MGAHSAEVSFTGNPVVHEDLIAHRIDDDMEWGAGPDLRPDYEIARDEFGGAFQVQQDFDSLRQEADTQAQLDLPHMVLRALVRCSGGAARLSTCTDRVLARGPGADYVDVTPREALPGGDALVGFSMLDAVAGRHPYPDPNTPWRERLDILTDLLKQYDILLAKHGSCEVLGRFPEIQRLALDLQENPHFRRRQGFFLSPTTEEYGAIQQKLHARQQQIAQRQAYEEWDPEFISHSGELPAGESLFERDAGQASAWLSPVPQIYRIQAEGVVLDARRLPEHARRRVLVVNDTRIPWLADHIAKGATGDNQDQALYEEKRRMATLAGYQFVDAALGRLVSHAQTFVVRGSVT